MFQPGCPQDILPTAFARWNFGLRCLGLQHRPWLQRIQSHGKAIGVPFLNIIDTSLITPKKSTSSHTLRKPTQKTSKTPLQNTCLILSHGVAIAEKSTSLVKTLSLARPPANIPQDSWTVCEVGGSQNQ